MVRVSADKPGLYKEKLIAAAQMSTIGLFAAVVSDYLQAQISSFESDPVYSE